MEPAPFSLFPRRVLVVYGTKFGHTERVARRIADRLRAAGHAVVIASATALPPGTAPGAFDGVVLGASIVVGKHNKAIRRFAARYHSMLNTLPSAFFSVSASAAGHSARNIEDVQRCLAEFRTQTGWYPPLTEGIGGEIAYTRYNPLLRWWMKRIAQKEGGPTDTSHDHVLTDWRQVDRFTDAFDRMMQHFDAEHPSLTSAGV